MGKLHKLRQQLSTSQKASLVASDFCCESRHGCGHGTWCCKCTSRTTIGSFGVTVSLSTNAYRIIGCAGGAQAYATQAYIFSHLINVLSLAGAALEAASNHWSLMFFILALGTGFAYFLLGFSSNTVSTVSNLLGNV